MIAFEVGDIVEITGVTANYSPRRKETVRGFIVEFASHININYFG